MEFNYNLQYPLILVFYMNRENFELGFFEQYTKLVSETIEGSNIKAFFCPLSKGDKERIECINPKLITEEEYVNVKTILDRNSKILNEYLASENKEWFVKTWFRKWKLFRLKND